MFAIWNWWPLSKHLFSDVYRTKWRVEYQGCSSWDPWYFFVVGTVFAFITAADNPRIFQEFDFFLNRRCNEFHFISFFVKEHRTLQMIFPTNLINTPSICKRYWYPIDIYSFQPPFNVNKQNQNQGAKKIPKHKSNRKIVKGVHKVKNY